MIYLGTIANTGSDTVNNRTTAAPFTIPAWVTGLRVQPSAATQSVVVKMGEDAAFLPAATAMLAMGTANGQVDMPVPRGNQFWPASPLTVAVNKSDAGAGTCKVFAIGWEITDY